MSRQGETTPGFTTTRPATPSPFAPNKGSQPPVMAKPVSTGNPAQPQLQRGNPIQMALQQMRQQPAAPTQQQRPATPAQTPRPATPAPAPTPAPATPMPAAPASSGLSSPPVVEGPKLPVNPSMVPESVPSRGPNGSYIPPAMITTAPSGPNAAEQGDVYSWDFPSVPAVPNQGGGGGAGGGAGGGGPSGQPTIQQQYYDAGLGGAPKNSGLPAHAQFNPWGQTPAQQAAANPSGRMGQLFQQLGVTPHAQTQGQPVGTNSAALASMRGLQFAEGGMAGNAEARAVMKESNEAEAHFTHSGLIHSGVPGRTDKIPASVASGAYIVPADVVSGLGEGNTLAGAKVIDKMMNTGPHGTPLMAGHSGGMGIPKPPAPAKFSARGGGMAGGGEVDNPHLPAMPPMPQAPNAPGIMPGGIAPGASKQDPNSLGSIVDISMKRGGDAEGAKIIVAGGEYHIHPRDIMRKWGNLKKGHDALDKWVLSERAKNIAKTKGLPGPKK